MKRLLPLFALVIVLVLAGCIGPTEEQVDTPTLTPTKSIVTETPGSTPEEDTITEDVSVPELVCSTDPKEAYQQHIESYNKVLYFMENEDEPTPASEAAYTPYVFYKDCWEAFGLTPYELNELLA